MGAVHSTSGQGLQVLETELAASKRSLEDIQAQLLAERKAAKDSAEACEARLKAQLSTAKISAAAADTESAESKKRFQELVENMKQQRPKTRT